MILELTKDQAVIPHFQNILDIHNNNPVLSCIDNCDPLFAGGYPMSLLLAPRFRQNKLKLKPGFYSDYDIYFSNEKDLQKAYECLDNGAAGAIVNRVETNNAITYVLAEQDPVLNAPIQLQLIKKVTEPPQKVLSSFDFINCAVGFSPKNKAIFLHKDLFSCHNIRELEILKPWMLDEVTDDTVSNVIIQVARFKKYCMRWDYTLGNKAFWKLMEVYQKYPHLKTSRGIGITCNGGTYDQQTFIAAENTNIWEAIASILRIHPEWTSYKDPHGIISGENIRTVPDVEPLVVEETQLVERQEPINLNLNYNSDNDDIPF